MTLYELTDEYKALLDLAEDPETDPEVIADTMEAIEGAIEVKADAYAYVLRELDADEEKIKAEIGRLKARADAIAGNRERIEKTLMGAMVDMGRLKIKTALNSFTVCKSGSRPVEIAPGLDPDDVPEEYRRVTIKKDFDKTAIRNALKEGARFQWARLGEAPDVLRIR